MSPSLSSGEIDALMSAIHQGMSEKSSGAAAPAQVISYDLTSQDRVIRAQLPTLDSINDRVASALSVGWGGRLRMMLTVTAEPSQLRKFSDFHTLLRPPATFVMLQLSNQHGPAVLVLPEQLVRVMLGAALGDRSVKLVDENNITPEVRKDLTNVERSVLGKLVGVLCDALASAWSMVLPLQPRVLRFETDPRLATVAPPGDVVIINAFQVALNEDGGRAPVHLGIPFAAVEQVKKRLAASPRTSSTSDSTFSRQLADRLRDVPVEARALLGTTRMTLKEFLALKAGDLLPLDTSESQALPLLVQGHERARGVPTVEGSRLALRLTEGTATSHAHETAQHALPPPSLAHVSHSPANVHPLDPPRVSSHGAPPGGLRAVPSDGHHHGG